MYLDLDRFKRENFKYVKELANSTGCTRINELF